MQYKFKEFRLLKKLRQQDLATYLGVSERQYRRYEKGDFEPSIKTLITLADFYNISLDELVGRKFPK